MPAFRYFSVALWIITTTLVSQNGGLVLRCVTRSFHVRHGRTYVALILCSVLQQNDNRCDRKYYQFVNYHVLHKTNGPYKKKRSLIGS